MKAKIAILAILLLPIGASAQDSLQSLFEYEKSRALAAIDDQRELAVRARRLSGISPEDSARIVDFIERLDKEKRRLNDPGLGDFYVSTIAHGVHSGAYSSVGSLLHNGETICSGTLVGRERFLTAKHCFHVSGDPADFAVYFQHAGIFELDEISSPPNDDLDVAIVHLQQGVVGIPVSEAPYALTDDGKLLQVVGFGITEEAAIDSGIKRRGGVLTKECSEDADQFICWDFNPPYDLFGTNSNICSRDSGGPVGASVDGELQAIDGIAARVPVIFQCHISSESWSLRVQPTAGWISQIVALDGPASISEIPDCCGDGAVVSVHEGTLPTDIGFDLVAYEFNVSSGVRNLRIGLNAADTPTSDLDLMVAPTIVAPDTKSCTDAGRYVFCEYQFAGDPPSDWTVVVKHAGGAQTFFQLVVTAFESTE